MDKLVMELLTLLREILAGQQRLLKLAIARRDAMRSYDLQQLESLAGQERIAMQSIASSNQERAALTGRFRQLLGRNVEPNVTEIGRRTPEPLKTQLLALAAEVRTIAEQVERNTRINATVSSTVVKSLAKVLKIVTGLAQHAGLYMRNGRKAAPHGIHLLEITA
jgi:flagellar biosynthesis/type III secretory pathway chaperone